MLFNSSSFLLFFIAVFIVNYLLGKHLTIRHLFLLCSSYYFYSVWNGTYLLLILVSTLIDYLAAIYITYSKNKAYRKMTLWVSLITNLGILGIFKYYNFFIDSAYAFFGLIGISFQYSTLEILLPVGISFYTFQSMSYTIDVYKHKLSAERNFVRFALYISFFPQLVAGPIIRPTDFLPQLKLPFSLTKEQFFFGLGLIWFGLFKKVVLADFFASYADAYFLNIAEVYTVFEVLIGVYAFAFQIYFDFSGYTDVAIGAALLLGYKVPKNFFFPYSADSLSEFWRRWHISLSTWLRDYLYIPLGGSKEKKYRNLFLTFLISGFWHGAAWNFVIWGAYHGVILIIENIIKKYIQKSLPYVFKQLIVFHLVCIGWWLFRVEDVSAFLYFLNLSTFIDKSVITFGMLLVLVLGIGIYTLEALSSHIELKSFFLSLPYGIHVLVHSLLFILITVFGDFGKPFIYFQF